MTDTPATPSAAVTIYYGNRRFLLLAANYALDRAAYPYRRLSATLLLACKQPFQLEVDDGVMLTAHAVLLAPKVQRRRTIAVDSDIAIFDIPIGTREYAALEPLLQTERHQVLDFARFAQLLPTLARAAEGRLACPEIDELFDAVVEILSGRQPLLRTLDARITSALALLEEMPFDQVTLARLAEHVHLSPSRLRHLFQQETGCTVSSYARWVAVWRLAALWVQGRPLTDIACEIGFHDLAHLDHAFIEVFGMNPSRVLDPAQVTLIDCRKPAIDHPSAY